MGGMSRKDLTTAEIRTCVDFGTVDQCDTAFGSPYKPCAPLPLAAIARRKRRASLAIRICDHDNDGADPPALDAAHESPGKGMAAAVLPRYHGLERLRQRTQFTAPMIAPCFARRPGGGSAPLTAFVPRGI